MLYDYDPKPANKQSTKTPHFVYRRRRILLIAVFVLLLFILLFLLLFQNRPAPDANTFLQTTPTPQSVPPTPTATTSWKPLATATPEPKDYEALLGETLEANYVVLYDLGADRLLYSKRFTERCYPASLTKLLTAGISLEYCQLDDVFTAGDELSFVAYDASVAGLKKGQQLSLSVLLDAMMLPSGNDAAYVVAVGIGRISAGDPGLSPQKALQEFLTLMNRYAQKLGATHSHFTNPDGYPDDDHYTTPEDFLHITRFALSFPAIRASASKLTAEYVLEGGETLQWRNTNALLQKESEYFFPYANGLKTGYTNAAGGCIAVTADDGEQQILGLLFQTPDRQTRFRDAAFLLNAIYASEA